MHTALCTWPRRQARQLVQPPRGCDSACCILVGCCTCPDTGQSAHRPCGAAIAFRYPEFQSSLHMTSRVAENTSHCATPDDNECEAADDKSRQSDGQEHKECRPDGLWNIPGCRSQGGHSVRRRAVQVSAPLQTTHASVHRAGKVHHHTCEITIAHCRQRRHTPVQSQEIPAQQQPARVAACVYHWCRHESNNQSESIIAIGMFACTARRVRTV